MKKIEEVKAAVVSFPRSEILALCTEYGPQMKIDPSQPQLAGKYVMAAIAANESNLGINCTPRHEPAWDVGGIYSHNLEQAVLLAKYGRAAASSYGPWQLVFYNCSGLQYTPEELLASAGACAECFLSYFNSYVQRKGAVTLEQIAQVYNGGHVFGQEIPTDVQEYAERLDKNYQIVSGLF